ncbi:MAG TPA: hypothetical protein VL977_03570 [Solirubrobacteraceae bacterium]|nr:hypothetical protein [Solirubrobacteraceae bacterium]
MKHARNFAILALIALAVVVIPGGAQATGLVDGILSIAIAALLAYFVGRLYRDRRIDLYGLGDLDRGILYASLAGLVVVGAAAQSFGTTLGALVLAVLLAACGAGLVRVYQAWRSY